MIANKETLRERKTQPRLLCGALKKSSQCEKIYQWLLKNEEKILDSDPTAYLGGFVFITF